MKFLFKKDKTFQKMKSELNRRLPLNSADLRCNCEKNLVSVILPVYNCEKYLDEAIISILSQTYTNFELIIVDDGSTDLSGSIADGYVDVDERVRVIHQKNMKLPGALNTGFGLAKGEFLTWTSADNRMLSVCLETLASELMHNRDCDMVFGNMRLIDENGNILRGYGWYELPPFSGNVILPDSTADLNTYANNTIGAAFMYRAGVEKVLGGYNESFYTLEDYDYFMRINYIFNIKHTLYKRPIYEYRFHENSLTAHDEELGITASRPELMSFDKERCNGFLKPVYYFADGCDKNLEKFLSHSACRIYSEQIIKKLQANPENHIIYINFGNTKPTLEIPHNIPKFLLTDTPTSNTFGYDFLLCRSMLNNNNQDWINPSSDSSMASFIILKAKCQYYNSVKKM